MADFVRDAPCSKLTIEFASYACAVRLFLETFPFWGMEWEIPVDGVDGKRDYQAIQRAWQVYTSP